MPTGTPGAGPAAQLPGPTTRPPAACFPSTSADWLVCCSPGWWRRWWPGLSPATKSRPSSHSTVRCSDSPYVRLALCQRVSHDRMTSSADCCLKEATFVFPVEQGAQTAYSCPTCSVSEYGISGHPNHISVSQGCQLWAAAVWKAGAKPLITAGNAETTEQMRSKCGANVPPRCWEFSERKETCIGRHAEAFCVW